MSRAGPYRDDLPSGGAPNVNVARNRSAGFDVPLPSEALQSPGVTPLPPASSSANIAGQILDMFRAGGALGDQYHMKSYYDTLEQRRLQHEAEAKANATDRKQAHEQDLLERTQAAAGVDSARVDLPLLEAQIKARKIEVGPGETVEQAADRLIHQEIGDKGLPEAHNDSYAKTIKPHLVSLLVGQQEDKQTEARGIASTKLLAGVQGSRDPASLTAAAADLRRINPTLTEQDALAAVGKATIDYAREANDRDALNAAESVVGGLMKTQIARARNDIDAHDRQQAIKANSDSRQVLSKMVNDGEPVDRVMSVAARMRKLGTLQEDDFGRLRSGFIEQEQKLTAKKQEANLRQSALVNDAAAFASGSAWVIPDKEEFTLADGRTVHLTRAERMDTAAQAMMRNNLATHQNDPAAAMNASIKTLSDNDYLPSIWKQQLEAGAGQANSWNVKGDDKAPLPPTVSTGIDLYQRLKAAQSPLIQKLPDATRAVYESIIQVQQHSGEGSAANQASAVLEARRLREAPPVSVNSKAIDAAVTSVAPDVKNPGDARTFLQGSADFYARLGKSQVDAVLLATQDYNNRYTAINGWAVDTSAAALPSDVKKALPAISDVLATTWLDKHPEAAKARNVTRDSIALDFSDTTGLWALVDAKTGRALPGQTPTTMEGLFRELQVMRLTERWKQIEANEANKPQIIAMQNAIATHEAQFKQIKASMPVMQMDVLPTR